MKQILKAGGNHFSTSTPFFVIPCWYVLQQYLIDRARFCFLFNQRQIKQIWKANGNHISTSNENGLLIPLTEHLVWVIFLKSVSQFGPRNVSLCHFHQTLAMYRYHTYSKNRSALLLAHLNNQRIGLLENRFF